MDNKGAKKQISKFGMLQGVFFSTHCSYSAFIVYYLISQGYSGSLVGTVMAVSALMRILGEMFFGYLCDRIKSIKKVFIGSMLLLMFIIILFRISSNVYIISTLIVLIGFVLLPQSSLIDSWIMGTSEQLAKSYGMMRLFGSIGYALVAWGLGKSIDTFGWNIMFICIGVFALITIILAINIPENYHCSKRLNKNKSNRKRLFRNAQYIYLVIITLLVMIPHSMVKVFIPVIIENAGGNPSHQGFIAFIIAIAEVPIFYFMKYILGKYKTNILILIAILSCALRIVLLMISTSITSIIWVNILAAITFPLILSVVRYRINLIAPDGSKTTAQAIATAVVFGLSSMLSSVIGGIVIDGFGIKALYYLSLGISIFVIIIVVSKSIIEFIKTES